MKFQKKIVLTYLAFFLVVSILITVQYYKMRLQQYEEISEQEIENVSTAKLQQMENILKEMEAVSVSLLSDSNLLDELEYLSRLEYDEKLYFDDASQYISEKINTYYLIEQFYRVLVYNKNGLVLENRDVDVNMNYEELPWKDLIINTQGRFTLLEFQTDVWNEKEEVEVFSVVKEVQGKNMGFIEVQKSKSMLDDELKDLEGQREYVFYNSNEEIIYMTSDVYSIDDYEYLSEEEYNTLHMVEMADGEQAYALKVKSSETGISVLTLDFSYGIEEIVNQIMIVALYIILGLATLSFVYVFITSQYLVKPLRKLKKIMENTNLDNIDEKIPLLVSNDEIGDVYNSYNDVLMRLRNSIEKEKQLSILQLQAQFDLLQAQVDPHFLFNILNIVSGRGMILNDEMICDICSDLAEMLRYATNTKEKYAVVRDEVRHLNLYLELLKFRYQHRLIYTVEIPNEIELYKMPKIILQQIVENSISHGYDTVMESIDINIKGHETDTEWYIEILDHGNGIQDDKRNEIKREFDEIREKLTSDRKNVELEIGGMGLVNIYARMYLLYGKSLIFEIVNRESGGVRVKLGVRKDSKDNV